RPGDRAFLRCGRGLVQGQVLGGDVLTGEVGGLSPQPADRGGRGCGEQGTACERQGQQHGGTSSGEGLEHDTFKQREGRGGRSVIRAESGRRTRPRCAGAAGGPWWEPARCVRRSWW